jgi:preprotein translocase subunit Sec61beta
MSSRNDSGLMSSAGLVRYFDSEDSHSTMISPKTVIAVVVLFGVVVMGLNVAV